MLKITIAGETGEGKTTLALLIAEKLAEAGIEVGVKDADLDAGSVSQTGLQPLRLQGLRARGTMVRVETVQVAKDGSTPSELLGSLDKLVGAMNRWNGMGMLELGDRKALADVGLIVFVEDERGAGWRTTPRGEVRGLRSAEFFTQDV